MEECFTRDTQFQRKYGHYALLISWLCHSHTLFHSAHSHSLLFYLTLNFLSSNSFHFAFPNSLYQHFILPPLTTTTTIQLHYTNCIPIWKHINSQALFLFYLKKFLWEEIREVYCASLGKWVGWCLPVAILSLLSYYHSHKSRESFLYTSFSKSKNYLLFKMHQFVYKQKAAL